MSRTWLWTALTVGLIALASYVAFYALRPEPLPEGVLYGNGHIEGTEVTISAEITGRVTESPMEEGQQVRAGNLLVRLDDNELKVRQDLAKAELTAIRNGITALKQQLNTWRHHLKTAKADYERFRELHNTGAVTPQQLSRTEDRLIEAEGQVKVLEAQLAENNARLKAAQQQLRLLNLQLEKTAIHAPIDATLLVKAIEAGELATPGHPVAVLVDLSRLELKVYIPERDIGKVKLGDPARIRVDAFPERYFTSTVKQVAQRAQFTPRDIHLPEERVRMVFGITLALDNPEGYLKPGMPADAWIRWSADKPWPDRLRVPR